MRGFFFLLELRKEAYLKGRGEGLSLPLHQFDVAFGPGEEPRLLETRHDPAEAKRWTLHAFNPGHGCNAALAIESSGLNSNAGIATRSFPADLPLLFRAKVKRETACSQRRPALFKIMREPIADETANSVFASPDGRSRIFRTTIITDCAFDSNRSGSDEGEEVFDDAFEVRKGLAFPLRRALTCSVGCDFPRSTTRQTGWFISFPRRLKFWVFAGPIPCSQSMYPAELP